MKQSPVDEDQVIKPGIPFSAIAVSSLAVISATMAALYLLPVMIPGMLDSLTGDNARIYWYLSRGSAIIAYLLLWASMLFGLLMTNKMSRRWPGVAAAYDWHQYISLLGIAFLLFHALILMGDGFIKINLLQILLPFGSANYRPVEVGLGQLGLYLWLLVTGTFYIKKRIGTNVWRLIHFASFPLFIFATLHGITSGSDSSTVWMRTIYWASGGSILFLTVYRILMVFVNLLLLRNEQIPIQK